MNLYKVKLLDPGIGRSRLVTVFIVMATTEQAAIRAARRENESAFFKNPDTEVTKIDGHTAKFASYMMPWSSKDRKSTQGENQ